MGRIRLLAHYGLTMIGVMATCIMRGVQPLQYRGHPMCDFNGENDATRHGRTGPGSAADLVKILSGLYKGEREDFLRTSPLNGFSLNNPRSWVSGRLYIRSVLSKLSVLLSTQELRRDVEGIQSPTPQPEDPGRSLDPASEEDPDVKVDLIAGCSTNLA